MTDSDEQTISKALAILSKTMRRYGDVLGTHTVAKQYLTLRLARKEQEVFGILMLNTKNALVADEDLFFGTLSHTSVYPREVLKTVLRHNAASIICYHNHPSGSPEPSDADLRLTKILQSALQLIDVRTLDHIIVAGTAAYSFAENGQI